MPYRQDGDRLVFDARTPADPTATVEPGEMPEPETPAPDDPELEDGDEDEGDDGDDGDEDDDAPASA
jgi:hypothetical protein